MVRPELYVHGPFAAHEPLQLQDALARHDNLLLVELAPIHLCLAQSQPMAVRRNTPQVLAAGLQEHAVQVIANVLLRHREMRFLDQSCERALFDRDCLPGLDVFNCWKLCRRQGCEAELASPGTNRRFFAGDAEMNIGSLRQRPAYIKQLASRYRDFTVRFDIYFRLGNQLHLQVRRRDRQLALFGDEQDVREYGHGLPPFHDPDNGLQGLQKHIASCA